MKASHPIPADGLVRQSDANDGGWLMYHSVGKFIGQKEAIRTALMTFTDQWCASDDSRWVLLDQGRQEMLNRWSDLIGAPHGSVMAAENVTACYGAFFEALPRETLAGRKVLIAEDCFPSLHFLLAGLAPRLGFELVTVRLRPGAVSVEDEDFLHAWDEKIAVAVITWVTSTASRRCDLDVLAKHGRSMGSIVTVDITQAVGCLPFNVNSPAIDFAASTALKWMCGVPGAGMAYISPTLLPSLEPRRRGWFSQPDPFNWRLDRFALASDARRFDNGTPSYLPYIASLPGLRWLMETGIEPIRAHNVALSAQLMEIADDHHLRVVSPRDAAKRGGTVVVEIPADRSPDDIQRALMAAGIVCDTRSERMRWSPGLITDAASLENLDRELGRLFQG